MEPEQTETTPVIDTAEAPAQSQRLLGIATLALIFLASAGSTVVYLNDSTDKRGGVQIAAAAASEDAFASVSLSAEAAYVFDLTTNRVLFSKNPDAQLPLASLTKVPLALVASEVLLPNTRVRIPPHNTPDGAPVRLPSGLQFEAQDIIAFTLVASSNEGAEILLEAARAGIERKYPEADSGHPVLWRMNDLAKNLGLSHTYFLNSSGLDLSATQAGAYGSARDIALLFAYAASTTPHVFEHTTRNTLLIRSTSGASITAVNTTDEVLPSIPGIIIGKTGYTDLAGGNLAIVFEVGPAHPVVAVVLHSTRNGRFDDMEKLIAATQRAIHLGQ